MKIKDLIIGRKYSNQDIMDAFGCSNAGGMRRATATNTLVLVCDHTKSLYDDMWHDKVLHYTGMGKTGNQSLTYMQNKTLYESNSNGVTVHLFEVLEATRYTYRGIVKLIDKPYQAVQKDNDGISRKVWMFPIKPVDASSVITPERYTIKPVNKPNQSSTSNSSSGNAVGNGSKGASDDLNIDNLNDVSLMMLAIMYGNPKPAKKEVATTQIDRNPYVSEFVKRRAKGKCDLCGQMAPFKDKKGKPYLECHHVITLADGGPDTIYNAVALCPNCHKKVHVLKLSSDISFLEKKVNSYNNIK